MNNIQTYQEAEKYILSIPKFTKKNTWQQTREFYEYLGKPGKESMIIHVAGTNGKGSVCAYMNSVLQEANIHTGMFTSPHLVTMRERMRLDGEMISEEEFFQVFLSLGKYLENYRKEKQKEDYHPAFFEFLFFLAVLFFDKTRPDVILLETGLGGRLDATNVIDSPKVCVITEIGMDHTEYLGDTYEKIAAEKAGIIKKGSTVVYSANRQESSAVILEKAKKLGVLCRMVTKTQKVAYRFQHKKIDFSFYSRYYGYIPLELNTKALYQVENVTLALCALEETGIPITKEQIQKGVSKCRWDGRMEEIMPGVFIDGAHNEDGIDAFLASVRADSCKGSRFLLFSAVADKEYQSMKNKLVKSQLFEHIYAAQLENARGLAKTELENIFRDQKVRIAHNACEGLKEILSLKKEEDFVYAAGSLYLAGEIKEHWRTNHGGS